jgi:hypothetical protein
LDREYVRLKRENLKYKISFINIVISDRRGINIRV